MKRMDDMVEIRILPGSPSEMASTLPLTLHLNVVSGKALWGYVDMPVLPEQEKMLLEVTDQLKKAGAAVAPLKRRVKFRYQGETVETETTTTDVYCWTFDYGLRYSLDQVVRFLTALDSVVRKRGGRPIECSEFFVIYKDGALTLVDETLSFVLGTPWGYYSAFLHVGTDSLELQICDEEAPPFPAPEFDNLVSEAVKLFESEGEIALPEAD